MLHINTNSNNEVYGQNTINTLLIFTGDNVKSLNDGMLSGLLHTMLLPYPSSIQNTNLVHIGFDREFHIFETSIWLRKCKHQITFKTYIALEYQTSYVDAKF